MVNFYSIPIVRFLLPFVTGIVFSKYFGLIHFEIFGYTSMIILGAIVLFRKLYFHLAFAVLFSFFAGNFVHEKAKPKINHTLQIPYQTKLSAEIVVEEVLKQTVHKVSFTANFKGKKVLFYLSDSNNFTLPKDTFFLDNFRVKQLDSIGTFANYNNYLKQKGIIGVVFLKAKNIIKKKQGNYFMGNIYKFRCKLCKIIVQHQVFSPNELGVFLSLILGERSYLPFELKDDYKTSGLIHILAISGLHVGVLFLFLQFLLKLFRIYHAPSQFIIVLILLSSYALVAGLSPSVVRAVLMCLMIQLGNVLQEKSKILNIVLSSALFLLIYQPLWLWDIGFQLSYLAVVFMVILLPIFTTYFKESKRIWIEKIKTLLWVNITASIGTFPILLYHFGVVYFGSILSGMFIVPFSSLAVIVGIGSLPFYSNYKIFHFLLIINNYLLYGMNQSIHYCNQLLIAQWNYQADLTFIAVFYLIAALSLHPKLKLPVKMKFLSLVLLLHTMFILL